jgi:hypothetical protein
MVILVPLASHMYKNRTASAVIGLACGHFLFDWINSFTICTGLDLGTSHIVRILVYLHYTCVHVLGL